MTSIRPFSLRFTVANISVYRFSAALYTVKEQLNWVCRPSCIQLIQCNPINKRIYDHCYCSSCYCSAEI